MNLFDMTTPWYEILLRTFVVYMTVLVLLRAAGKRELGQMTPFDLVVILVIANAVQNAMTGGDNSLIGGMLAAATLTVVNIAVGRWGSRVPFFRRLVASEPTLLLRDGKPMQAALDKERIDIEELEMAARQHGIADLADVTAAVLEEDGSISIIPKDGTKVRRSPRHFRQFRNR
ncbi:MAG TPA: YetF domain-containing protein [Candidatus Saccharimonadales bacterium]|nr:YetF domain-containing protein [Candidatus Saccharimonadales bacterium]